MKLRTYQLRLLITEELSLEVGRLGVFSFPSGIYVYTGSARNNIDARVARHFSKAKKLRWHIDYLLAPPQVRIIQATLYAEAECELNQRTPGRILVAGFGSSDCRNRCGSHLKYQGPEPADSPSSF